MISAGLPTESVFVGNESYTALCGLAAAFLPAGVNPSVNHGSGAFRQKSGDTDLSEESLLCGEMMPVLKSL